MNINPTNNVTFGWNTATHLVITEEALNEFAELKPFEKRWTARCSQLPDLMKEEIQDCISPHFYDVLHEDPSFGTVNDDINNAFSRFLMHHIKAIEASKKGDRDLFLRETGYAAHYLQDAATPPHTEHGNYLHKLFRLPMHCWFEKSKKYGAKYKSDVFIKNHKPEEIPVSSLAALLHNNALFTVQPENLVRYHNMKSWHNIQQRCFDRSLNSTKAYFKEVLKLLPKCVQL